MEWEDQDELGRALLCLAFGLRLSLSYWHLLSSDFMYTNKHSS